MKHHKTVRRNTKKNGRKGKKNTVEVDEMEGRGEECEEAEGKRQTLGKPLLAAYIILLISS